MKGISTEKPAVGKRSRIGNIRPATYPKDFKDSTSTAGEVHPIDERQREKTDDWDAWHQRITKTDELQIGGGRTVRSSNTGEWFPLMEYLHMDGIYTKESILTQQWNPEETFVFNENFIHRARERVRIALITVPVD